MYRARIAALPKSISSLRLRLGFCPNQMPELLHRSHLEYPNITTVSNEKNPRYGSGHHLQSLGSAKASKADKLKQGCHWMLPGEACTVSKYLRNLREKIRLQSMSFYFGQLAQVRSQKCRVAALELLTGSSGLQSPKADDFSFVSG